MYRGLFLIIAVLFIAACALSEPTYTSKAIPQGNRAFDNRVIQAFSYEKMGEYAQARDMFLELFAEYKSSNLLENAFALTLFHNLDKKDELNELAKPYLKENATIARFSAAFHLQNGDVNQAQKIVEDLIKWDKDYRNYELLGDLYLQKQAFALSLQNYKTSKAKLPEEQSPNEILTLKIAENELLLASNSSDERKKLALNRAKKELESFVDEAGACTLRVCMLLAQIYSDSKENAKLENLHIKLYELTKNTNFLRLLIENLMQQKQYDKALQLALNYNIDDDLTLFLYERVGKLQEAYEFALKNYREKNDKKYLLIAAVMEFENATKKQSIDKKLLNSVSSKFEEGIDEQSGALYLNYYGYLLIDYDLDIKKGMNLVERALVKEPNNLFYLDSLSWGYYKQGQCNQAWDIMLKTMHDKEFSSSKESKEHIRAIQQCLSGKK